MKMMIHSQITKIALVLVLLLVAYLLYRLDSKYADTDVKEFFSKFEKKLRSCDFAWYLVTKDFYFESAYLLYGESAFVLDRNGEVEGVYKELIEIIEENYLCYFCLTKNQALRLFYNEE